MDIVDSQATEAMRRQIFRKKALERLASPEQLDQLMPLTRPCGWMALCGIAALLLLAILWSIVGTVETTVQGQGMLVRLGGVQQVRAPFAGAVSAVYVGIGETVGEGKQLVGLAPAQNGEFRNPIEVLSPAAGRILNVAVVEGDVVQEGSVLLTIEAPDRPLQAVVYVPARDGYLVQASMEVRILPATATRSDPRYLRGKVIRAGRHPGSRMAVMRSLENEEWVSGLSARGPALEVVVELVNEDMPLETYSGTPCEALITVDEQRPIQFVLPAWGS